MSVGRWDMGMLDICLIGSCASVGCIVLYTCYTFGYQLCNIRMIDELLREKNLGNISGHLRILKLLEVFHFPDFLHTTI